MKKPRYISILLLYGYPPVISHMAGKSPISNDIPRYVRPLSSGISQGSHVFSQRGSQHGSLKSSCPGLNLHDPVVALPIFSRLSHQPAFACYAWRGHLSNFLLGISRFLLHTSSESQSSLARPPCFTCIVVGHHVILHSCCERPPSLTVAFIMSYPSCWWLSPHYFSFPVQGIDNHQPFLKHLREHSCS